MKGNTLFFADRLPPHTGGMEMHATHFINYFSRHTHFPLEGVITKDSDGNDLLLLDGEKRVVQLEELPSLVEPSSIFYNSGRWIEEMDQIQKLFPRATFFYRTGGNEILKAPLVKNRIADHYLRQQFWVQRLNASIDILITNSAYTEGRLLKMGVKSKFFRSVGGVNAPALKRKNLSKVCWESPLAIFSAARFVPYKNHLLMIRAIKDLVSRGFELKLLLAGDGPLLKEAEALVRDLELQNVVEFLGALDNTQTCFMIAQSDVYMQLSGDLVTTVPGGSYIHSEGMGRSILEALTAGTFVVAGKSGALPEIVTPDRGVLIDLRSKESIVDEMERVLNSLPKRNDYSNTYCWSKIFQNYETLFYDAVKNTFSD